MRGRHESNLREISEYIINYSFSPQNSNVQSLDYILPKICISIIKYKINENHERSQRPHVATNYIQPVNLSLIIWIRFESHIYRASNQFERTDCENCLKPRHCVSYLSCVVCWLFLGDVSLGSNIYASSISHVLVERLTCSLLPLKATVQCQCHSKELHAVFLFCLFALYFLFSEPDINKGVGSEMRISSDLIRKICFLSY